MKPSDVTCQDEDGGYRFTLTLPDGTTISEIVSRDEARDLMRRGRFWTASQEIRANLIADAKDILRGEP